MAEHSARKPTPLQIAIWLRVLVAATGFACRRYDSFQVGTYRDDAAYVVLTRSLIDGQYGLIDAANAARAKYPFGYPLLLSPFMLAAAGALGALTLPSLLAPLANATILFWGWPWFSRSTSYWRATAVVALSTLAPLTISHSPMVMPEPIFVTCCARRPHRWSSDS